MHWIKTLNLYFYAICEALFFFPLHEPLLRMFLRLLEKTQFAIKVVRETLFPLRANYMLQNRNNRIITFEDVEKNEDGEQILVKRRVILPPAQIEYSWNYVEGFYLKEQLEEFSDTDEDGEEPKEKGGDDGLECVNLTSVLNDCKGPYRDFYGSVLTPYMIDRELQKLVFYKKDRKNGEILHQEEFFTHQVLDLSNFV